MLLELTPSRRKRKLGNFSYKNGLKPLKIPKNHFHPERPYRQDRIDLQFHAMVGKYKTCRYPYLFTVSTLIPLRRLGWLRIRLT